jgi:type II secretory pathway pseudopilin PulG
MAAFSLLELLFVLGLAATLTGLAVPQITQSLDDMRTAGAARYVASRLQQTRMEAISRTRGTALRFTTVGSSYAFTVYVDGNRNGVLTADIEDGIDQPIARPERLIDQFPRVDFGTVPGLPPVDADGMPPGADPIRLGTGNLAAFTSSGTSTTGSIYVRGRDAAQFAIRLFGQTGKTRILRFNARTRTWTPL